MGRGGKSGGLAGGVALSSVPLNAVILCYMFVYVCIYACVYTYMRYSPSSEKKQLKEEETKRVNVNALY